MRKTLFFLTIILSNLFGQDLDESFFNNLDWRNIGPNRGGRSLSSMGSPSRPNEYYFGATGGGLWKTTDGSLESMESVSRRVMVKSKVNTEDLFRCQEELLNDAYRIRGEKIAWTEQEEADQETI